MKSSLNKCIDNELIEVSGICDTNDVNAVIEKYQFWKQMHISETLDIPQQKPDIEQINSVDVSANIVCKHVVVTPRTYDDTGVTPVAQPNLEGKLLTGRKLIIEGQLCQKVVYTAAEESQPVHSAHFYVPFSSYIVVPKDITFTNSDGIQITEDACNVNFDVNVCIEDVAICALDSRRILKQVTLMLNAVPTQSC